MANTSNVLDIVIIGAGIGGLTAAIMLQRNLGHYDYTIYEMASDLGGTWHANEYPGCACDLPAHWYSLSMDPNPDWSCLFAGRQEIQQYWRHLAHKYNVASHINFNTEFSSAVWNGTQRNYTLKLRDSKTKEFREVKAKLVISAIGVFKNPHWPNVPGIETFQGKILHAQRWDYNVGLSGKRVGLIGNGCAGSQILPVISEDSTTTVINFCRTPSWYIPRPQMSVSPVVQWVFRHVPFVMKSLRYTVAAGCELLYNQFKKSFLSNLTRKLVEKAMLARMKSLAPSKYHKNLTPSYSFGCKCIIFDPGYLESLGRANVDMEWDPIARINSTGIITRSGKEHQLDVIDFATGFEVADSMTPNVIGINGLSLREYYDNEGGPTGYMGTTIPGFPNWVTIFGPNTVTGHSSVLYMEELQVNYALKLFKPVIEGRAGSIVPRADSTRKYNDWVQYELKGHVWPSCHSWYRKGGGGKITAIWPGGNTHLWWSFREPIWKDYEVNGAKNWAQNPQVSKVIGSILQLGLLAAGAGALALVKTGRWNDFVAIHVEGVKELLDSLQALLS